MMDEYPEVDEDGCEVEQIEDADVPGTGETEDYEKTQDLSGTAFPQRHVDTY